jgi:hypothetical protein
VHAAGVNRDHAGDVGNLHGGVAIPGGAVPELAVVVAAHAQAVPSDRLARLCSAPALTPVTGTATVRYLPRGDANSARNDHTD